MQTADRVEAGYVRGSTQAGDSSDADAIKAVTSTGKTRFTKLNAGEGDVLWRNTTITFSRDVGVKLRFHGVNYYDGQGFMVRKDLGVSSARIGRIKRRLRWLREYRPGRCRVRHRYESRRIAVGMVRFRTCSTGRHVGKAGRRWRAKGTGGEAQRGCGAPAGGRGQDKVGNGEAGGWACGGWSGGARG